MDDEFILGYTKNRYRKMRLRVNPFPSKKLGFIKNSNFQRKKRRIFERTQSQRLVQYTLGSNQ